MSWIVYKHVSPSGKVYVGITSNIKNRWAADGYYYQLSDTVFSRALKKYGWNNFQHIIIEEGLTQEEACTKEKQLIAFYKTQGICYNITDGGLGYSGEHSQEHNKHKSEARINNSAVEYLVIDKDFNYITCKTEKEAAEFLGGNQRNISHVLNQPIGYTFRKHYIWKHKKGTPVDIDSIKEQIQKALALRHQRMSEHTKNISEKMVAGSQKYLRSLTAEERKVKFGNSHKKGWHHSEETRRKLSDAAKGRDMSRAVEASQFSSHDYVCKRAIIQYTPSGEFIKEFLSIIQASRETGILATSISNCLNGRSSSSGGYRWRYK